MLIWNWTTQCEAKDVGHKNPAFILVIVVVGGLFSELLFFFLMTNTVGTQNNGLSGEPGYILIHTDDDLNQRFYI